MGKSTFIVALLMVACCALPIILVAGGLGVIGVFIQSNFLIILAVLALIVGGGFLYYQKCCNTHNKKSGDNKELYQCEECSLHYKDKKWAEKCESWCKEKHSCNLEITRHAEETKNI